jgi:hypothetical protein
MATIGSYSDTMLIKYLKWAYSFLDKDDTNPDEYFDNTPPDEFAYEYNYDKLTKPFGTQKSQDLKDFIYALLKLNAKTWVLGEDLESNFIRPQLNTYIIEYKVDVREWIEQYWEVKTKTYIPESDMTSNFIYDSDRDELRYYEGELTSSDTIDDEVTDEEVYDIRKIG